MFCGARVERFPPEPNSSKYLHDIFEVYQGAHLFASAMSRFPYSRVWLATCSSIWNLKNLNSLLLAPWNAYFMLRRNSTTLRWNSWETQRKYETFIKKYETPFVYYETFIEKYEALFLNVPPQPTFRLGSRVRARAGVRNSSKLRVGHFWSLRSGGPRCCGFQLPMRLGPARQGGPLRSVCRFFQAAWHCAGSPVKGARIRVNVLKFT